MKSRSLALTAVLLVSTSAACDPTFAIVVENEASQPIFVGRVSVQGDEVSSDVVRAPSMSRTTIGASGVARTGILERIVLMTEDCDELDDREVWAVFDDGGLVVVGEDLTISFLPGGNPVSGDEAIVTGHCPSPIPSTYP